MKKLNILVMLISMNVAASNLSEIRDVLKHVETDYNLKAIGDAGASWGILQIQKRVILDVNRKYGTSYTHQDVFELNCAEEIFELYIQMWTEHLEKKENRLPTEEDIVRIWNGGPTGYKRDTTLKYLKRNRNLLFQVRLLLLHLTH